VLEHPALALQTRDFGNAAGHHIAWTDFVELVEAELHAAQRVPAD